MKKIICVFFVIVILLQSAGLSVYFQIEHSMNQYRMHEMVENSGTAFEKLTLTIRDYKKSIISKDEILFQGLMYDVKSVSYDGDKVNLLAVNDSQEKNIIQKINELVSSKDTPERQTSGNIFKLIKFDYLFSNPIRSGFLECNTSDYFIPVKLCIVSCASEISTPPPRLF